MPTLWFEEADKPVWHRMTQKLGPLDYKAVCGWHLAPFHGRIWPQKRYEPGPAERERCRSCVGVE